MKTIKTLEEAKQVYEENSKAATFCEVGGPSGGFGTVCNSYEDAYYFFQIANAYDKLINQK